MYAKAKKPKSYRPRPVSARVESLDLLDRLILAATFGIDLPKSIWQRPRVECCEFETGNHDHAARGWMKWERLYAFRPDGYEKWYRPDLCEWVADPLEGYRRQPVHVTAPEHREYVRHAA